MSSEQKTMVSTVTFPALGAASAAADADIFPVTQSGADKKQTFNATATYVESKISASGARYLSDNNYSTDNLLSATNFTELKSETDDHIADLNNPHQTTLQQVFDQDNVLVIQSGTPLFVNDINDLQIAQINDNGTQNHATIFRLNDGDDINITSTLVDILYCNDLSDTSNSLTIQLETVPLYADNATFYAWNNGDQILSVMAPTGVTINGIDNHAINVSQTALLKFSRLSLNEWQSNIISASAGTGIDIAEDGTISLDGAGASAGYGYVTTAGYLLSFISFINTIYYLIPFSDNNYLVNQCNNFVPFNNSVLVGMKYTGVENCVAEITFTCVLRYDASNLNSASNNYVISANLNLSGGPAGSFAPINPLGGGAYSGTDVNFTIFPNYMTAVTLTFQIPLSPNDVVYPVIRNTGPTSDPSLNKIIMTSYSMVAEKIGDVGGTAAGVTSLGGLTGNLNLSSSENTITITPTIGNIDLNVDLPKGTFTPTIDIISGADDIAPALSHFWATSPSEDGIFTVNLWFNIAVDDSGDLVTLRIHNPPGISANFTDGIQALLTGFSMIETSLSGSPGNIGCGWFNTLVSDPTDGNAITLLFEAAQVSTNYLVTMSYSGRIQAAPILEMK